MITPATDPTPKYIITPDSCMAPTEYGDDKCGPWLESALHLNYALMNTAPEVKVIVDNLFEDIISRIEADGIVKSIKAQKSLSRIKQTSKVILLNLYVAYLIGLPVKYSRDRSKYGKHKKKYGNQFFKYSRVVGCVKAFEYLGLIKQKHGFNDRLKGVRRQTRMWATPALIQRFHKLEIHQPRRVSLEEREQIIELRNAGKVPISYADTKQIRLMRNNLQFYNKFINQQEVTVKVNGGQRISLNSLNSRIYSNIILGTLTVTNLIIDKYTVARTKPNLEYRSTATSSKVVNNNNITTTSMTQTFFDNQPIVNGLREEIKRRKQGHKYTSSATKIRGEGEIYLPLLSVIIRKHRYANRKNKNLDKEVIALFDFGIRQLEFIINNKSLYRVFSNSSFEAGGRFYGGYHETMPKDFRPHIFINNQPTVELDYSAHHIRIAYHLEGIDYKDDPYMAMTTDPTERTVFKLLLLVLLNAETENSAMAGFRDTNRAKLKECLGDLNNSAIQPYIERVKRAHPQIAGYIHSGAGVKFQYLDSKITEAIIVKLAKEGIPCLPVHDSYIVPQQNEKQLYITMIEEYKRVLGFEPLIELQ